MTDEEKAEEWLDERYLKDMGVRNPCKKAFLAGLEAGRETECEYVKNNALTFMREHGLFPFGKWHNLQKNPKDLPEPYSTVLDENADKITYCGGDVWTVYSDYYERDIDAEPPKVWCEIPKFEE